MPHEYFNQGLETCYAIFWATTFSTILKIMLLAPYSLELDDFELKDSEGNKISPISGLPSSESDVDPTYQVRMGAEYVFTQPEKYVIPLRGGIFYDPAPAEGSPDDFYGISLDSGITSERFSFDIAYQYRFGNNVGESILQNLDFSQDVKEHTVYSPIIIYF